MNNPPADTQAPSIQAPADQRDIVADASSEFDPLRTITRDDCVRYMEDSIFKLRPADYRQKHPQWPGLVGLEIEMLAVQPGQGLVPPVSQLFAGSDPTSSLLEAWGQKQGWKLSYTDDDQGHKRLLTAHLVDGDMVSFEPGGQVEVSTRPYPCLAQAVRQLEAAQGSIEEALKTRGFKIVQTGINPWHTKEDVTLQMRKSRYRAMDQHFAAIGPYGQRMMRQTCTVQVNLDFGSDETTLAKRYLASELMAPFVAGIFANSPIVDRKPTGIRGYRTRIWRHTDPSRTGLPALARLLKNPTRQEAVSCYIDFAMNARVVFVESHDYLIPPKPTTFGQLLEGAIPGVKPTLQDFITHLSLLFPEVRPRGFLELRSADCQPRAFQGVPAVLWTGLLYSERILDRLIESLVPYCDQIPELMVRAEDGLQDPLLARVAVQIMGLAQEGFSQLSSCYKEGGVESEFAAFRHRFTEQGRTPADDIFDVLLKQKTDCLGIESYQALEDEWMKIVAI